jgi:hypothetical protein
MTTSLAAARRAKAALQEKYRDAAWLRGVGIAPAASGFHVRLNVDPETGPPVEELPEEIEGVPIEVLRTPGYRPR